MAMAFDASPEVVRSQERSHSVTEDNYFTSYNGKDDTDSTEARVAATERKLFDSMGVMPRHCESPRRPGDPHLREDPWLNELKVSPTGGIEGGLYPPFFYEYQNDLMSDTWEAGLDAINAFDWDRTPSDKQCKGPRDSDNSSDSMSIVDATEFEASPPDSMSQDVPPDDRMDLDETDAELINKHDTNASSEPYTAPMVSPSLHDPTGENITLMLPASAPSTPHHQAFEYSKSSPPWIESPPAEVNVPPKVQMLLVSHPPSGNMTTSNSGMTIHGHANSQDMHTASGGTELDVQVGNPEDMHVSSSPEHKQTTVLGDIAAHGDNLEQPEGEGCSIKKDIVPPPAQLSSPVAKESISDNLDKQLDDVRDAQEYNKDIHENDLLRDASTNTTPSLVGPINPLTAIEDQDLEPPAPEPSNIGITELAEESIMDVDTNNDRLSDQMGKEARPDSKLETLTLEQTTLHAPVDSALSSPTDPENQNLGTTKITDMSLPVAPSVPEVVHMKSPHENVEVGYDNSAVEKQHEHVEVCHDDSSVEKQQEHVPSIEVEASATPQPAVLQLPLPIRARSKPISEILEEEEIDVVRGSEQATPTEASPLSHMHETGEASIKLKIGSRMWNEASPGSHQTKGEDAGNGERNAPDTGPLESNNLFGDIVDVADSYHKHSEGSITAAPILEGELSEEEASRPLLAGLEEAAAGIDSNSSAQPGPVSPTTKQLDEDGVPPWPGTLLEHHLDLPPSPFSNKAFAEFDEDDARSDTKSFDNTKTPEKAYSLNDAGQAPSTVPKKDAQLDSAKHDTVIESSSLSSPMSSVTKETEVDQDIVSASTAKSKKRTRPTTARSKNNRDPAMAFSPDEVSGSEYEAPVKKKQKQGTPRSVRSKSAGYQAPTTASSSKSVSKLPVPPPPKKQPAKKAGNRSTKQATKKGQRGVSLGDDGDGVATAKMEGEDQTKPMNLGTFPIPIATPSRSFQHAIEPTYGRRETRGEVKMRLVHVERVKLEEERANLGLEQEAVRPQQEKEELLVDAGETMTPASKPKGKGKTAATKTATGKASAATATTPAVTARATRSKTPARAATPMSSSTGSNISPDPAAAKAGRTKRQTRQAAAAQELQRKEAEAENNVGKRTRSALSKP